MTKYITLTTLFFLLFLFELLSAQVPSTEEAERNMANNFPAVIGVSFPLEVPTKSLRSFEAKERLRKLEFAHIFDIEDDGASARIYLGYNGKDYLMGTPTNDHVVIAGAFVELGKVKQVTIHPEKNATYIISCEIKILSSLEYTVDKYPVSTQTMSIEMTESSNGWVFSPGSNSTHFFKKASEIPYGRSQLERQRFHKKIPEIIVDTWVESKSNDEKYYFNKGNGTFWHCNVKKGDTIKGTFTPYLYQMGFLTGYTLKTEAGEEIDIRFLRRKNNRLKFQVSAENLNSGTFYKKIPPKYEVNDYDAAVITNLTGKLAGRWKGKKKYFIEFFQNGTMKCFLPKQVVNFKRTQAGLVTTKEVSWEGKYWICPHFSKGMKGGFAIVIGTEPGDLSSEKYFWIWDKVGVYHALNGLIVIGKDEFEKQ